MGDKTRAAVFLPWDSAGHHDKTRTVQARLEEAVGLALSIGLEVVHQSAMTLRSKRPATLFGSGQVEQAASIIKEEGVDVAIIDTKLSPIQQRNLEKALACKVIDRTALILDIFGERASTKEGSLQVELAHLEYQKSRLVRSWTHLERQRGGFGFLGGPGETQIEADRRMISERIVRLKKELEQVRRTRGLHREARRRVPFPVVALVGYTNAGKSTLFNRLTGAGVHAQDQLFATLDPTMRGLVLPSGRRVILSDTVGFISDLPTELIAAFRATLEEVASADIILHVRDISHPDTDAQYDDVNHVMQTLARDGTLDENWAERIIEVWNKIDLIAHPAEPPPQARTLHISALQGKGIDELLHAIDTKLLGTMELVSYQLPLDHGAAIAWLYQHGEVTGKNDTETETAIEVRLSEADRLRFEKKFLI